MFERAADYVIMSDATFRGAKGAVFANANWRLASGERWAIRGVSGAGKSLFLAAITGRLPRLAGVLRHPFLEGQPHCADSIFGVLPPGSIAVASMEQHRAILSAREFHQLRWHGSLSSGAVLVREFLSQASVMLRNPFAVTDLDDTEVEKFAAVQIKEVERWDLKRLLERPLMALSNGELHRLLVARALMLEPRLLMVDDPYTGLDARTRALLTDNLAALEGGGTGVLYAVARDEDVPATVTHELEIAACVVGYTGVRRSVARTQISTAPATRLPTLAAARSPSVVLELCGVTVRQGVVTLLEDVNLTIRDEERWALVGPNGAGKSTLLSLILADNPQSYSNRVVVGGRQLGPGTSIWDIKRLVGWVSPELDAHYPSATSVADVVLSGFRSSLGVHEALGVEAHEAAASWVERVGLKPRIAEELGGLQRLDQRLVFLARACVHRPKLLLLDEPCQGLDAFGRARFAEVLGFCLAELRAALVYVTHETSELPPSIDHVLELRSGKVVGNSTTLTLLNSSVTKNLG